MQLTTNLIEWWNTQLCEIIYHQLTKVQADPRRNKHLLTLILVGNNVFAALATFIQVDDFTQEGTSKGLIFLQKKKYINPKKIRHKHIRIFFLERLDYSKRVFSKEQIWSGIYAAKKSTALNSNFSEALLLNLWLIG